MRPLVGLALVMLATVLAVDFSQLHPLAVGVDAACTPNTQLNSTDTVNVAVLVYLIGQPAGLFTGDISETTATDVPGYGTEHIQPGQLAFDMFVKMMRARDGMLPLPNGQSVKVNYVYVNIAGAPGSPLSNPIVANYADTILEFNVPKFLVAATVPDQSAAFPPLQAQQVAFFTRLISTDSAVLQASFGISTPFTFIVAPPLYIDAAVTYLANRIENAQSHVLVTPFTSNREMFICDGVVPVTPTASLTPDCLAPVFNRKRRGGARRYETLFSALMDTTQNQNPALETFYSLGIKSVVIINDDGAPFSRWAARAVAISAGGLNIVVKKQYQLWTSPSCDPTITPGNVTEPNCPPMASQKQVFQNRTTDEIALELLELNADALIIIATSRSSGAWTLSQLFPSMKKANYAPKAISWGGGIDTWMETEWMKDNLEDLKLTWSSKPWSQLLKGPNYQTTGSDTQFELIKANATHDGPWKFYEAYEAAYGPNRAGGNQVAHPMYYNGWTLNGIPAICWQALAMVQKMIEASMTKEVPSILQAATRISTPGVYQQLQFDLYGRTARVNPVLLQKVGPQAEPLILAPVNIASMPIYPLPTWEERVFAPAFYAESNEQLLVALTAVSIFLCLLVTAFVCWNWRTPVIRAATPSFCLLTILGGVLMLTSNFFTTLVVNDAHCATSVWLLTLGFSVLFSALFTKTFRIYKIFMQKKLQVVKISPIELLVPVLSFVAIDIIINAAWMGAAGMNAIVVVTDPERPSRNYLTCDYSDGVGAIYAHLAIKAGILLFGVGLTYAVRNTPSAFNEASLIGLTIYNASFVVCFIIPIISSNLGGRNTVYLIRGFAIIFVVLSSMGLLYVPKMLNLTKSDLVAGGGNKTQVGNTTITPTSPTNKPPKLRMTASMQSGSGTGTVASGTGSHGSGGIRPSPASPGSGPTRMGTTQVTVASEGSMRSVDKQNFMPADSQNPVSLADLQKHGSTSAVDGLNVTPPQQDHVRSMTPPIPVNGTSGKYELASADEPQLSDPGLNTVNTDA